MIAVKNGQPYVIGNPPEQNFVFPECTEPFEYAPGQFIEPNYDYMSDYYSTVYFTFINKIAEKVAEKYPDVKIKTLAYYQTLNPPRCELRDNVYVVFSTINEDLTQPFDQPQGQYPELDWAMLQKWLEVTDNLIMYGYYGCCYTMGWYERPVWYRMQDDFRYYAENGLTGVHPPIYYDSTHTLVLDKHNWGFTNKFPFCDLQFHIKNVSNVWWMALSLVFLKSTGDFK